MSNETKKTRTPIYALALLGPRAMKVVARHKATPSIASYEQTLEPKVTRFAALNQELTELLVTQRRQVADSNAQIDELYVASQTWRANLQLENPTIVLEDIAVTETRSADVVLHNAGKLTELLRGRPEMPYSAEAVSDLEAKTSNATAAFDAAKAGRVAVQEKQRELNSVAAEVHAQLVALRKVLRITLGPQHLDCQMLRAVNARLHEEPPDETEVQSEPVQQ
jgi:hypothetical protein